MYDARPKAGGLNEYGIAQYKAVGDFAQAEVDWLLRIGGITVKTGMALGREVSLAELQAGHDAVFLGMGLAGVNALRAPGEELAQVRDAVDFIAELRQAKDKAALPVGRDVVVIGGGMTAVDAAVQSRLLGAETVSIVYRRGQDRMSASGYEQNMHQRGACGIHLQRGPVAVHPAGAGVEVEFAYMADAPRRLKPTGENVRLRADQVFKAIGQTLTGAPGELTLAGRKIAVSARGGRPVRAFWAGGDCAAGGDDLTVTAVAEGRDAAEDIHATLMAARA